LGPIVLPARRKGQIMRHMPQQSLSVGIASSKPTIPTEKT
jgi:hypothetical protein